MMNPEYSRYLPPFGSEGVGQPSHFVVLCIATWTAILAAGCLRANNAAREREHAPGSLWFILVLAIVWLVYLIPLLVDFLWNLFVQGQ